MVIILHSVFIWIATFLLLAPVSILTLVILFFVPYPRVHKWLTAPAMAACLRLTGSRFRVTYDASFDPLRPSVYCQNHVNLLDAHTASAVIPHAFCGIMHSWQFKIPFYGWLMKLSEGIPVSRALGSSNFDRMVEAAKDRKKKGMSILTFPEGHRTRNGRVDSFKKGVFRMARDAGYPIVPIAVKGMFEVNQKGSLQFRPGTVEVRVGPQFETAGLSDQELPTLIERTRDYICAHVEPAGVAT